MKRPDSSGTRFYKVEGISHNTEEERAKAVAYLKKHIKDEKIRKLICERLDLPFDGGTAA